MKAPCILLMAVTIAFMAGVGPALSDAADVTAPSLSKAVDALEAATGGKVLEIRFVDETDTSASKASLRRLMRSSTWPSTR